MNPTTLFSYVQNEGLLAKWRLEQDKFRKARGFTFNGHLGEVMSALDFFFTEPYNAYPSFGRGLYDVMHLARHATFDEFKKWCEMAALGHDLGKCGGEFQMMLWELEHRYREHKAAKQDDDTIRSKMKGDARHRQSYRHEFLSAVLMYHQPDIRAWFRREAGSERGFGYTVAGAFGHHLKANFDTAIRDDAFLPGYQPLPVFLQRMTHDLAVLVRPRGLPEFPTVEDWTSTHPILQSDGSLKDALRTMLDDAAFGGDDDPVSSAVKWMVILSDTFGSISQTADEKPAETRARVYGGLRALFSPTRTDYARRVVARIYATAEERARPGTTARAGSDGLTNEDITELLNFGLRPLQASCDLPNGEDLIVTASTGGGKTVAGLVWSDPSLRLVFTTPTTDTATRIYFDYANGIEDTVRHSRSWMDLPRSTPTPEDTQGETSAEQGEWNDAMAAIDGFDGFSAGITFTTADQVLGVMAYYRKSVMWLLYLVSAQIVFDEFHAYDETMHGWYLRFLEWFPGLRTAHMSATVPGYVKTRLDATLASTGKRVVQVTDPAGAGTARSAPRFRIHVIPESEAPAMFAPGSLWITNTVQRCQEAGNLFPDAIVYHSRFRYTDRRAIRDRVIHAIRTPTGESVISTQVAEMSLDISALRLISEVCPPASLIQRMGRVNRDAIPDRVADVYVYLQAMDHGFPYSTKRDPEAFNADYARWMKFIQGLSGRDISQDDLEIAFQEFYLDPVNHDRNRVAHTDQLRTFRRDLREGSITVQCILKSDLDLDPTMSAAKATWLAIPAILGSEDRDSMDGATGNSTIVHEHHFVLDNTAPGWTYDSRLGLLNTSSRPGRAK